MPVLNSDVARIFNRLADLLEIESANPFRVRAYRNAARTASSLPKSVSDMIKGGHKIKGITIVKGIEVDILRDGSLDPGCFLEINSHPDRLDLSDRYCRMAKEKGVKLVISTDAHRTEDLAFVRFGVDQARRGWLEAEDVVNTRSLEDLRKLLKR